MNNSAITEQERESAGEPRIALSCKNCLMTNLLLFIVCVYSLAGRAAQKYNTLFTLSVANFRKFK